MRGLGRIIKKVIQMFPELSFRLSLDRNGLLVDTVPSHDTVSQYSEHLLAELEQMGQQAKRRDVPQEAPPKLRLRRTPRMTRTQGTWKRTWMKWMERKSLVASSSLTLDASVESLASFFTISTARGDAGLVAQRRI